MFKKPPKTLKTSAPLRGSDRRKLRQRIVEIYSLNADQGNELVPDGLLSQKFTTHSGEPGIIYLGPNGDPLWFSIGKNSDEMIPTVYTLWKRPLLISWMTTPGIVIRVLARGADMMCPGAFFKPSPTTVHGEYALLLQCKVSGIVNPGKLPANALVCIREDIMSRQTIGPALAVARMAVDGRRIIQEDIKTGKAAVVLHMVGDKLWEMGSRPTKLPEPLDMNFLSPKPADSGDGSGSGAGSGASKIEEVGGEESAPEAVQDENEAATEPPESEDEKDGEHGPPQSAKIDAEPSVTSATAEPDIKLTPDEVTTLLRSSLLQAIQTTLSSVPQSSFPISSSIFYTNYILPARPLYVRPPPPSASSSTNSPSPPPTHTPVDIKHSTHKSLSTFLRASQSQGLIKLKDNRPDASIVAVFPKHPDVEHHRKYRTVGDEERKERREREMEEGEREGKESGKKEMEIEELWKPHQTSVKLFEDMKVSTSDLYNLPSIKSHLNTYLSSQNLVNLADQSYINIRASDVLNAMLSTKGTSPPEFMKREELIKAICGKMQNWYRIGSGEEAVVKKGELKPISVIVKIRAGRKACTLITGHEQFGLKSEDIAEALKAKCASSTTVSSLPGKSSGEEVMVQGKQLVAVKEYLTTVQGVPKRWFELTDATVKKKK